MPEIDAVRVRVLLEQLCELEPAFRRVGKEQFKFDLGEGKAWCYLSDNHAIRDALEALHDARGWIVWIEADSRNTLPHSVQIDPKPFVEDAPYFRHDASTRLEAMLEATNKALGGAS